MYTSSKKRCCLGVDVVLSRAKFVRFGLSSYYRGRVFLVLTYDLQQLRVA